MKTKTLFSGLMILVILSCSRIPSMKEEIVNALDAKELELINENPEKRTVEINANFFYGNDSLYISDKKQKRIIGIDGLNKVFMEIGNLKDVVANQDEKFWEKELKQFIDNSDDPNKKQALAQAPKKKIREKYNFQTIDKIVTDLDGNIYIIHYLGKEKEQKDTANDPKTPVNPAIDNKPQAKVQAQAQVKPLISQPAAKNEKKSDKRRTASEKGMEILKFSSEGKFLYRIGEEGRDNPSFDINVSVVDMIISKDNGLWLKYIEQGVFKIRFYNHYGKNTQFFEENKIQEAIQPFVEKKDTDYYRIEDLFPMVDSAKISVVINLYKKDAKTGGFAVSKKKFFRIKHDYSIEDYWEFKDKNVQVFNINIDNNLLCFSYFTKERTPLLKVFNDKGNMILEKKISLQKFNYKRIAIALSQQGNVMGAFLKKNIIYFVIWK